MNKISKKERKKIAIQILDEGIELYKKCSAIDDLTGGNLFERIGFNSYSVALKILGLGDFIDDEGVIEAWCILSTVDFVDAMLDKKWWSGEYARVLDINKVFVK